jgi:hypothetical protein
MGWCDDPRPSPQRHPDLADLVLPGELLECGDIRQPFRRRVVLRCGVPTRRSARRSPAPTPWARDLWSAGDRPFAEERHGQGVVEGRQLTRVWWVTVRKARLESRARSGGLPAVSVRQRETAERIVHAQDGAAPPASPSCTGRTGRRARLTGRESPPPRRRLVDHVSSQMSVLARVIAAR